MIISKRQTQQLYRAIAFGHRASFRLFKEQHESRLERFVRKTEKKENSRPHGSALCPYVGDEWDLAWLLHREFEKITDPFLFLKQCHLMSTYKEYRVTSMYESCGIPPVTIVEAATVREKIEDYLRESKNFDAKSTDTVSTYVTCYYESTYDNNAAVLDDEIDAILGKCKDAIRVAVPSIDRYFPPPHSHFHLP